MSDTSRIPFLDLVTPHRELREELVAIFDSALDTAEFIGGQIVEAFERQFAEYCDVSHCIGVGSGTDALRFALIAAGVGEGDITVTVPNTFIATTEAISQSGSRPVFVDIDEQTYNMDPRELQRYFENDCYVAGDNGRLVDKKLGRPVAAIVPVHLYGQPADMDQILALAERYNLIVIEDACQAHGAKYFSKKDSRWKTVGSMGRAAAFSFYPGKNLGACGEAGAVTTNDAELNRKVRMLRDHGQAKKYHHDAEGYNGRLDAIQAGLLQVKLKHLLVWNEKRRKCASEYADLLRPLGESLSLPYEPSWAKAVYHLYVVRIQARDQLRQHLSAANVDTGIHYPIPLHLQRAYDTLGYGSGEFPVCEKAAREILSLPMYPGLNWDQQARVASLLKGFLARRQYEEQPMATGRSMYLS